MSFIRQIAGVAFSTTDNRERTYAMPTPFGESRTSKQYGDPWMISEWEFPTGATMRRQLEFLTRFAVLAPSGHNRQPWRFRIARDRIEILADRSRSMPTADPRDRELIMSCGTALNHLRVAMTHYGIEPIVHVFPNLHEQDLVASVSFGRPIEPTVEQHQLFMAIRHRRTHRGQFADRSIDLIATDKLREAVHEEGVAAFMISDLSQKARVAALVSEGEISLLSDSGYVADLARWIRIPIRRHVVSGLSHWRERRAHRLASLAGTAPLIAVLSTVSDTAPAWLATGQAISHVLLKAREFGVYASFINQPVVATSLRTQIAEITGGPAFPQIVLRLGYADESSPTERRTAASVIIRDDTETM